MPEYDAFAEDFHQTRNRAWPEFEFLYPHIKKQDRILDLGCGNARLRHFLPPEKIPKGNYFGLDISENLLQKARENFRGDHFFRGDFAKKLPFGADNFEIITSVAAFHHLLSKKDQQQFLSEAYRVLKPGGTLFMTTWKLPQKYFWSNILRLRFKNWIIPFGQNKHPRTYRRVNHRELRKLLQKAGFLVPLAQPFETRNYIVLGKKIK